MATSKGYSSKGGSVKETTSKVVQFDSRRHPQKDKDEGSVCLVCHDRTDIYALGQCDHPICHRCSTRMRVLCGLNYCPICRTDLLKVLFDLT
jgi:hypothetical protein